MLSARLAGLLTHRFFRGSSSQKFENSSVTGERCRRLQWRGRAFIENISFDFSVPETK
jgi:hypothetical protein